MQTFSLLAGVALLQIYVLFFTNILLFFCSNGEML